MDTNKAFRFAAFNIWGDFFGNPPHERDLEHAAILLGHDPDFIGLQEMTPNFWKSRLVDKLAEEYEVVGKGLNPYGDNAADPVFIRRSRFDVEARGGVWFCPELDKSKGAVWAVATEKASGRKLLVFASHFWWQQKGEADKYVRLLNARKLHSEMTALAARFDAAIIGGGDLNAPNTSPALSFLLSAGWEDAQRSSPETDPRATWHGNPERDASGAYRGVPPEKAERTQWLDHVFYAPRGVKPLRFAVDTSPRALNVSDHSPLVFDFELRQ